MSMGQKGVRVELCHSHPNPKWTPASRTEPLFVAVPGWRCSDPNCPTVEYDRKFRRLSEIRAEQDIMLDRGDV